MHPKVAREEGNDKRAGKLKRGRGEVNSSRYAGAP